MANKYRNKSKEESKPKQSIFGKLQEVLKPSAAFTDGIPPQLVPKMVFVTFLGVLYIGNRHYSEKLVREIDHLEVQVEDLRADYTTTKSHYMTASKRSEVLEKVKRLGLEEAGKPPYKIVIDKGEF